MAKRPITHVFIVDGTLSRLDEGCQTHASQLYHLLEELADERQRIGYHEGVQGRGWRRWKCAALGIGVNDAIKAGYAFLAERYRPGDRVCLFGYSRGAYAVRSLAGLIGRVGLLKRTHLEDHWIEDAFCRYMGEERTPASNSFKRAYTKGCGFGLVLPGRLFGTCLI